MYKQQQNIISSRIHGFTLLELMITVALVGLLASIGIPSFTSSLRGNRLTTSANEFISAINLARSEAVKRNQSVSIRKINGGDWEDGWNVFVDLDSDGTLDAGEETIRTYPALQADYTLRGNNNFTNFIRYKSTGESNNLGSFVICDNSDNNNTPEAYTSKLIIVNAVGRPRMGTDVDSDGIPEKSGGTEINSCTSP